VAGRRADTIAGMRLYDTLTRSLLALPPPGHGPIGMYVCGPTVYQRAHIGNARPFVVFSWLGAWLRLRGYEVRFVHNITDVNDKIYEAAPGRSAERAAEAAEWYLEDVAAFGLGLPDAMPRATETVGEIVAFVQELLVAGHAYESDGDVYFRVASFAPYGALSRNSPEEMRDEEPSAAKEDPRDFALWKATKEGEDTAWDSPWGRGRPGWHIECSAMAEKELGGEFWIHGGGVDLVFPHHENERAQSNAAGRAFAKIWMHNGLLRFTGEKMSKSLGNVATIQDVLREPPEGWGREAALLFFLTAHWRKPIDFSAETMAAATAQAQRLRDALLDATVEPGGAFPDEAAAALDDDFNTPAVLSLVHGWVSDRRLELAYPVLELFGLGSLAETRLAPPSVLALAERRRALRASGDYVGADAVRGEIVAAGWEVRDVAGEPGYRLVPA
jgi:cysteinyl-tRNA synthetase